MAGYLDVVVVVLLLVAGGSVVHATAESSQLTWIDARTLSVRGRAFNDTAAFWNRLPAAAKGVVRGPVWYLSQQTAGMAVQFETNATSLWLNTTLLDSGLDMIHFPTSGVSGSDLYVWDAASSHWRWVGTTASITFPDSNMVAIAPTLPTPSTAGALQRYRLHLPLYNGVVHMAVGFDATRGTVLRQDSQYSTNGKPVIWYGTSICQGGVVTRPGQAYTNVIGRNIDREIINFGFSGNGIMEISVAQFLVHIDAAVILIDCLPNMDAAMVAARTQPLVHYFRSHGHATTPIILVEGTTYGQAWLLPKVRALQNPRRNALRTAYNALIAGGDKHLHYVTGDQLLRIDNDLVNPTVSGTHPTDLGHYQMSAYYETYLPTVLAGSATSPPVMPLLSTPASTGSATEAIEATDTWSWTDWQDLTPLGHAFSNQSAAPFARLPASAQHSVSAAAWAASQQSAGLAVAFSTDATAIALNYTTTASQGGLWDMPSTGTSGCDLYRYDPGNHTYRFAATVFSFPSAPRKQNSVLPLVEGLPPSPQPGTPSHYILFLPLHNGVVQGQLGVPTGSAVTPGPGWMTPSPLPPIVWYGTGIVQGRGAARAAQALTNVLSRRLHRQVLNLGFSGAGNMELGMAGYIAEAATGAAAIVIDCLPGMTAEQVTARTQPLVKAIRDDTNHPHPTTPIVLVEGATQGRAWFDDSIGAAQQARRAALHAEFSALVQAGDKNLHYITGDQLFGSALVNPTVDGEMDPSDLGQYDMADVYLSLLPPILQAS